MYQKKGGKPLKKMPHFKMALYRNEKLNATIFAKLKSLGFILPTITRDTSFLYNSASGFGAGNEYETFIHAELSELSVADLLSYEIIPIPMTKGEIEKMIGHNIIIIEEDL